MVIESSQTCTTIISYNLCNSVNDYDIALGMVIGHHESSQTYTAMISDYTHVIGSISYSKVNLL